VEKGAAASRGKKGVQKMSPNEKARTGARWPMPKRQNPGYAIVVRQHFSGKTTIKGQTTTAVPNICAHVL
jgi:hypothetical protein